MFIGVALGVNFVVTFRKLLQSRSWTLTDGKLIKCTKKTTVTQRRAGQAPTRTVRVDVEYEYWVHHKKIIGTRVTFSDNVTKTDQKLDKLLSQCKSREPLPVYYNPSKHTDSVLINNINIYSFTTLFLAFLFGGVGFYLTILWK